MARRDELDDDDDLGIEPEPTPEWIAKAVSAFRGKDYPQAIAACLIHLAEVAEDMRWAIRAAAPEADDEVSISRLATLEDPHP